MNLGICIRFLGIHYGYKEIDVNTQEIIQDIHAIEEKTMNGLKDFQRATVERIDSLFRNGQKRVLVADEVGLGKTLIARGVIAKTAKIRLEDENDDLFKVVYICSNLSVASQNILKLNVFDVEIGDVSSNRLSMQHLLIAKEEHAAAIDGRKIQLIPMTPGTSFQMTSGGGDVIERALMFAILRRMPMFDDVLLELEKLMEDIATQGWKNWVKQWMEDQVSDLEEDTNGEYPKSVIDIIEEEYQTLMQELHNYLILQKNNEELPYRPWKIQAKLRKMFAEISVKKLDPDLVIMDEFQRFKFLIEDDETETGLLAKKFFSSDDIRVLLLSATPYKLYSTLEEIEDNAIDEHYSEFLNVMRFLFDDKKKISDFENVWTNYSIALRELKSGDAAILSLKADAENAMYGGVCRTERISVMDSGDYTDDSAVKNHIKINENDILSYIQMGKVLEAIDANFSLPIDYVKSCPYLMSFMRNYKVKERIEKYFKNHPDETNNAKGNLLWINKGKIDKYEPLPKTNARLEELKRHIFDGKAELYLWVPPSKPYYEFQGPYKGSEGFSKLLVFSSWEMVPRMIGSLVSYEAERLTIGRLGSQARNEEKKNTNYFAEGSKRFPVPALRFNVNNGVAQGMSMFCLIYPSETLANLYNPIEYINNKMDLRSIEKDLISKLQSKLDVIENDYCSDANGREDAKWYYLAPMLMDGANKVKSWIWSLRGNNLDDDDDSEEEKGHKGLYAHLDKLQEYFNMPAGIQLGKRPHDLEQVLVNMILGSPAICIYRSNGQDMQKATELARIFVNRFNSREATAIVNLAYGRRKDTSTHWKNVIRYCKDGNFQAMFDEYTHLISEGAGFSSKKEVNETIHNTMKDALKIHAASYAVDTFADFKARIENRNRTRVNLRSQFAVGFTKSDGGEAKNVDRKDSIRNAFNSPLRPFVLATTSIGQEGLDFHNYCRKIMHWNLPSNPIDLEQREGRINRFKCLAIRQNIAEKYGDIEFVDDIWTEMFEKAGELEKQDGQSDLVPFWCLGKNQDIKIERIVPMYPISKDEVNYERLIKILSLYRLTLGQARQEELLEYMFSEFEDCNSLKELFINLSPYSKEND